MSRALVRASVRDASEPYAGAHGRLVEAGAMGIGLALVDVGMWGQPEDIANAILFFCSKQADWITGQVMKVGGGHMTGRL